MLHNHAVGSGCLGPGQAMLDTQLLAQQVQLMVTTGLFLPTGEQAISELFTVVGHCMSLSSEMVRSPCAFKDALYAFQFRAPLAQWVGPCG
jgi:hypothetical protein